MELSTLIDKLEDLVKLDVDASSSYSQAIDDITDPSIRRHLERYQQDHEEHIIALSDEIERFGGTRPSHTPSITGFFITGFTAIRSAMGLEGALRAMEMNEHITNRKYEDAASEGFPPEIHSLITKHLDDERRHLAYIQRVLRERLWEQSA
jgi:uncharacterized protein (TIGR02284 family)